MHVKSGKVFYGWWIVGAVFLIQVYAAGVLFFGFTALFEPIASDFGWSYAQISLAASIRGLELSFLSPLAGLLFDRFGPRKLIFAGAFITGLSLLLLGRINTLATFYIVFVFTSLGLGTIGGGVVPMAAVGNWFRKKLTTAIGIVVSGSAIGGLLVPLVTRIIDIFGWRAAMAIFGVGAWVILLPLSLMVRHKPEQYGYLPDGEIDKELVAGEGLISVESTEVDIEVKQALKSSVFWHVALGLMCHIMVVTAVTTHVMPYLSSIGISRSTSSLVASAIPVTSILGRLSFGWFGDRFDKRWVAALGFALLSLSTLLFAYVSNVGTWLLIPFIILLGIGYGGLVPMMSALPREYFGRIKLGTILGLIMGVAAIGAMVGPPMAGWVFDNLGSYQGAWLASTGVAIVGLFFLVTAPSFVKYSARG